MSNLTNHIERLGIQHLLVGGKPQHLYSPSLSGIVPGPGGFTARECAMLLFGTQPMMHLKLIRQGEEGMYLGLQGSAPLEDFTQAAFIYGLAHCTSGPLLIWSPGTQSPVGVPNRAYAARLPGTLGYRAIQGALDAAQALTAMPDIAR